MKKKILSLLLVLGLSFNIATPVYAHEIIQDRSLRWQNNYYMSQYNVRTVDVRYNGDYLNSNWRGSVLSGAMSDWNDNSDHRAAFFASTYSSTSTNLRMATWTTRPSFISSNIAAWTDLCDTNGNWLFDLSTGDFNENCSDAISLAHIYTNPDFNDNTILSSTLKRRTLGHESGHVICLGHPDSDVSSIMQALLQSCASTPQTHDRDDLASFYPN